MHYAVLTCPENFPVHIKSPFPQNTTPGRLYRKWNKYELPFVLSKSQQELGKACLSSLVWTQINRSQEARLQETGQDVWSCSCLSIRFSYADQWGNNSMNLLIPRNHNYACFSLHKIHIEDSSSERGLCSAGGGGCQFPPFVGIHTRQILVTLFWCLQPSFWNEFLPCLHGCIRTWQRSIIVTSTEATIAALTSLGNDGKCPLRMTQRAEAGLQSRLVKDARSLVLWVLRLITDVASGGTLTGWHFQLSLYTDHLLLCPEQKHPQEDGYKYLKWATLHQAEETMWKTQTELREHLLQSATLHWGELFVKSSCTQCACVCLRVW